MFLGKLAFQALDPPLWYWAVQGVRDDEVEVVRLTCFEAGCHGAPEHSVSVFARLPSRLLSRRQIRDGCSGAQKEPSAGHVAQRWANNEHTLATLGESERLAVEQTLRNPVPALPAT